MKVELEKVPPGGEGALIKYSELTPEIEAAIELLSGGQKKLSGTVEGGSEQKLFTPSEALYFESVDSAVYAYLAGDVLRLREKLETLLSLCEPLGFIRCSRTMLVNIRRIERLKSVSGGRILATMENGEGIMISRRYASGLRERLLSGR